MVQEKQGQKLKKAETPAGCPWNTRRDKHRGLPAGVAGVSCCLLQKNWQTKGIFAGFSQTYICFSYHRRQLVTVNRFFSGGINYGLQLQFWPCPELNNARVAALGGIPRLRELINTVIVLNFGGLYLTIEFAVTELGFCLN